jgi:hypothetical protein
MKRGMLVVAAFLVVSISLTWVWNEWLRHDYALLFKTVAEPLYRSIGFENVRIAPLRTRYINFVPFVSLVVVTPGIELKRRSLGLALGLVALFASHLALNLTGHFNPGMSLPIVPALLSDSLPFLFWLVVAYPALVDLWPQAGIAGSLLDGTDDREENGERSPEGGEES